MDKDHRPGEGVSFFRGGICLILFSHLHGQGENLWACAQESIHNILQHRAQGQVTLADCPAPPP